MKSERPVLYITVNNHFDPTWRRCWDRRFTFKGQTFVSYADLQEYYMLDNLAIAAAYPEYKFEAEFSLVVQKFLERHPDRLPELQALARAGRFGVTGGGQVIVDANMIQGESLARNYVIGLLYIETLLGQVTRLGVRNDGFGNPAQLPQILRGVELDWVTGLSYSPAQRSYWRGLDGSAVFHASLPRAGEGGDALKYKPCPQCAGTGSALGQACPACAGRGITVSLRSGPEDYVDPNAFETYGCAEIRVSPEELLPNLAMPEWARARQGEYDVRFALEQDLREHFRAQLAQVDNPPLGQLHPGVELNPNNTGVYVTRIRTKQTARRQEHALYTAEWLNCLAAARGASYPRAAFDLAWKDLLFTLFHDAITATHIDPAYAEIQDFWTRIDTATAALRQEALASLVEPQANILTVLNPTSSAAPQVVTLELPAGSWQIVDEHGVELPAFNPRPLENGASSLDVIAAVPAQGALELRAVPAASLPAEPRARPSVQIENERMRVQADDSGLLSVYDKLLGREILAAGAYRPAELILEHDEGSPWATLHRDQSRSGLSASTILVAAQEHPAFQRLIFEVGAPFRAGFVSGGFSGRLSATLYRGIERLDFHLEANWDTYNHRLRAAFPFTFQGRHLYEIPYGVLERKPYPPNFHWASAGGDWPAIHWAGVEGSACSAAVFNRGTPSYQIEAGHPGGDLLTLSLLRSPAVPTYLHEPEYYSMTDFDGMRDAGRHAFDFALSAYPGPLAASPVVLEAEAYNRGLLAVGGRVRLPAMPTLQPGCARLAACKWAEAGQALVLRLAEFHGTGGEICLNLPAWAGEVSQVNLLERQARVLPSRSGQVRLALRPWEIATLRIVLQPED